MDTGGMGGAGGPKNWGDTAKDYGNKAKDYVQGGIQKAGNKISQFKAKIADKSQKADIPSDYITKGQETAKGIGTAERHSVASLAEEKLPATKEELEKLLSEKQQQASKLKYTLMDNTESPYQSDNYLKLISKKDSPKGQIEKLVAKRSEMFNKHAELKNDIAEIQNTLDDWDKPDQPTTQPSSSEKASKMLKSAASSISRSASKVKKAATSRLPGKQVEASQEPKKDGPSFREQAGQKLQQGKEWVSNKYEGAKESASTMFKSSAEKTTQEPKEDGRSLKEKANEKFQEFKDGASALKVKSKDGTQKLRDALPTMPTFGKRVSESPQEKLEKMRQDLELLDNEIINLEKERDEKGSNWSGEALNSNNGQIKSLTDFYNIKLEEYNVEDAKQKAEKESAPQDTSNRFDSLKQMGNRGMEGFKGGVQKLRDAAPTLPSFGKRASKSEAEETEGEKAPLLDTEATSKQSRLDNLRERGAQGFQSLKEGAQNLRGKFPSIPGRKTEEPTVKMYSRPSKPSAEESAEEEQWFGASEDQASQSVYGSVKSQSEAPSTRLQSGKGPKLPTNLRSNSPGNDFLEEETLSERGSASGDTEYGSVAESTNSKKSIQEKFSDGLESVKKRLLPGSKEPKEPQEEDYDLKDPDVFEVDDKSASSFATAEEDKAERKPGRMDKLAEGFQTITPGARKAANEAKEAAKAEKREQIASGLKTEVPILQEDAALRLLDYDVLVNFKNSLKENQKAIKRPLAGYTTEQKDALLRIKIGKELADAKLDQLRGQIVQKLRTTSENLEAKTNALQRGLSKEEGGLSDDTSFLQQGDVYDPNTSERTPMKMDEVSYLKLKELNDSLVAQDEEIRTAAGKFELQVKKAYVGKMLKEQKAFRAADGSKKLSPTSTNKTFDDDYKPEDPTQKELDDALNPLLKKQTTIEKLKGKFNIKKSRDNS